MAGVANYQTVEPNNVSVRMIYERNVVSIALTRLLGTVTGVGQLVADFQIRPKILTQTMSV